MRTRTPADGTGPARLEKMALTITINGQSRIFSKLASPVRLAEVVTEMDLKADRVAVELNGEIAPRVSWHETSVSSGDRLEVVHFVGGGAATAPTSPQQRAATSP
jgi:sulfur carrier protein